MFAVVVATVVVLGFMSLDCIVSSPRGRVNPAAAVAIGSLLELRADKESCSSPLYQIILITLEGHAMTAWQNPPRQEESDESLLEHWVCMVWPLAFRWVEV